MAANRREQYRLWFEYLRLAQTLEDGRVRAALKNSAKYYEAWGDISKVRFESWWSEHCTLLEPVRVVTDSSEFPFIGGLFFDPLYVEVHLRRSIEELVEEFESVLRAALADHPDYQSEPGTKFNDLSNYPIIGEARTKQLNERLVVYQLHLRHPNISKRALLEILQNYYREQGMRMPHPITSDAKRKDPESEIRGLNRMIQTAEGTILAVAHGYFPKMPKEKQGRSAIR
jgi:hypothetical protein